MIDILYQDNRILVCLKPFGVVSTDEPGGLPSLLREQTGTACFRTVHRLDQVVGGVIVLARSKEAARRLSAQIQCRDFDKQYLAIVQGAPEALAGTYTDLLSRDPVSRRTCVVTEPGRDAREAVLDYRVLARRDACSLVQITLHTGRTHQIRAQFSSRGMPLLGDRKYGAAETGFEGIALWSHRLEFTHPQTEERAAFTAFPPPAEPWTLFGDILHA